MLEAYNPGDVEEVNVVYVGHGGRLPARVRALIDFLAEEVDLDDALGAARHHKVRAPPITSTKFCVTRSRPIFRSSSQQSLNSWPRRSASTCRRQHSPALTM